MVNKNETYFLLLNLGYLISHKAILFFNMVFVIIKAISDGVCNFNSNVECIKITFSNKIY